jgi:hypothetical protein
MIPCVASVMSTMTEMMFPVVGCCEHGNELSGSINSCEFLEQPSDSASQEGLCSMDLFFEN